MNTAASNDLMDVERRDRSPDRAAANATSGTTTSASIWDTAVDAPTGRQDRRETERDSRRSDRDHRDSEDSNPGDNLFVGNLSRDTTEAQLQDLFDKYGKVS